MAGKKSANSRIARSMIDWRSIGTSDFEALTTSSIKCPLRIDWRSGCIPEVDSGERRMAEARQQFLQPIAWETLGQCRQQLFQSLNRQREHHHIKLLGLFANPKPPTFRCFVVAQLLD